MNLFQKIDWFYRTAQDIKTETMSVPGTADKAMPSKGYPSDSIRAAAKSCLIRLVSNSEVPLTIKKSSNQLGDFLRDYINKRFSDQDLNYQWGSYLAAIMDRVNGLGKTAQTETLGNFYFSLFDIFSEVWDDIAGTGGWETHVNKPMRGEWVGAVEDPWAASRKTVTPTPKPSTSVSDIAPDAGLDAAVQKHENDEASMGGLEKIKTHRKDRFKKLAKIFKR